MRRFDLRHPRIELRRSRLSALCSFLVFLTVSSFAGSSHPTSSQDLISAGGSGGRVSFGRATFRMKSSSSRALEASDILAFVFFERTRHSPLNCWMIGQVVEPEGPQLLANLTLWWVAMLVERFEVLEDARQSLAPDAQIIQVHRCTRNN